MSGILCFINCRGDKAFCSTECRENFMEDEMEEGEPMIYHPAPPSISPLDNGPIFQLIRWVKISNNLIWSYLKCCLRLISCSHGCDHVCGVVAWRFCLCGLPHLLISLFCVLGSSNFLEDFEEWLYLWSYYYLDQRGACVCACLNLSLAVWTSFSVAVGCSTLVLLSCTWTYVFSMYFGKEMVNYDINKCLFCKSAIYPWH